MAAQCADVVSVMCRLGIRAVWARAERVSLRKDRIFVSCNSWDLELKPAQDKERRVRRTVRGKATVDH